MKNKASVDQSLSVSFSKYMEKYNEMYISLAKRIKENIKESIKKPLIVDLSAGPGFLSYELNKILPNAKIIGLDPSINMIKLANDKLYTCKECNLVLSTVENIPLPRSSSDIVVSRFGISSWDDPKRGLSEVYRILKSEGKVVLEVLNKDYPKLKLFLMKLHMFVKGAEYTVIRYNMDCYKVAFSLSQTEDLLNDVGFKIINKEGQAKDWKFLIIAVKE